MSSETFLSAIQHRRSYYQVETSSPISDQRIEELLKSAIQYTPSSFHMQSARAVLLLNNQHERLWSIVMETLRSIVPEDKFSATQKKINSFAAGHGTILFFDDAAVVEQFGEKFPEYQKSFNLWAQQSNGILQFSIWTLLEQEGLGASLQHYNPLIDQSVKKEWSLPDSWQLIAQMPFGTPTAASAPKQYLDPDTRVLTFG